MIIITFKYFDYIDIIMFEVHAEVKGWGRSLGVVIPKKAADKEHLKAGDKIKILILKPTNALQQTFGIHQLKQSTKDILKQIDKKGWDE
jgi:antitoxin component of MazEF toxin-antitoxin module